MLSILSYKINSFEVFCWRERRFSHLASLCGLLLQHPNMPVLIHTSKRKSLQHPDHTRGSPTRRDDVKSSLPTVPLIVRNLAPASKGRIEAPGKRCAQTPSLTCVNPPKKPRLSPVQTPQHSDSRSRGLPESPSSTQHSWTWTESGRPGIQGDTCPGATLGPPASSGQIALQERSRRLRSPPLARRRSPGPASQDALPERQRRLLELPVHGAPVSAACGAPVCRPGA